MEPTITAAVCAIVHMLCLQLTGSCVTIEKEEMVVQSTDLPSLPHCGLPSPHFTDNAVSL